MPRVNCRAMQKLKIFVDIPTPPDLLGLLEQGTQGHELVFARNRVSSVLAKAEPDPRFGGVDVAFGQPDPSAIIAAGRLKWIHVSTSGITRYDNREFREFVARRGIVVTNSARVYNEACAVHALSFILAQARNLPLALQTRTANGTDAWHHLRRSSTTLRGEAALLVGYGAIGRRLAELLAALGMKVIAHRRRSQGDEAVPIVTADELDSVLRTEADHVIDILPDSAETKRFFDARRFAAMKAGAVFYNIGRGTTVDQEALAEALQSGHLKSAWLDVTDPEPLPEDHPLWSTSNCYITPHTAGGQAREAEVLVRHFLENLNRFVRGEPLLDRVM